MIRSLRLPLLAFLLVSTGPLALSAQEPPRGELQALSYYHQQGDQAAAEAEMRRLRLKYPQWMPPADLSKLGVSAPSQEIDRFYRQVAAGDFEGARATLAETKTAFPEWQPPADMTGLLAVSEGQKRFDEALRAGNLRRAGEIAGRAPDLLRCERINNAWRLAEAQSAAGRKAQAFGLYQSIITACTNSADLSATLEKADQVATETQLRGLFDTALRRFPSEAAGYQALQSRLLAGRGITSPGADRTAAPAETARPPAPRSAARPAGAQPAPQGGGGGGSVSPRSVQSAKDRGDWAGCLAASEGNAAAAAQYNRAWCAYNLDRPMEAVDSFRRALAGRMNATERRDAQYGIALAYLKMGMTEPAAQIAAQVDLTRSQRVDVERQILDQRGVAAYKARNYVQAIRYFDALEQISGGINRNLGMLRAWSYLNVGQRTRARSEFLRMHNELASVETARGIEASGD
ncbi:tetratricopeptide repeat protein [Falsigemmobacter faecalis]|uniref:Tetratricopeptide repeat protein n=1 Tax=Falsigemmobacter faecalis TaxID=2488730 RepID=A0A3P3DVA1_9RHOB|nr:tetratricopeptide repeat protein [Falsigemmobacter faecalis]RRH78170.1 hypothetical protein EG244_01605 [Falsigemmobacter faecalis]